MQLDKPVPLSTIANTPAVKLTPLAKEQESSVLPPMTPEREVSIEEIANTPAVQLTEIQGEVIKDALPDYGTYAASAQHAGQAPAVPAAPQQPAAPAQHAVSPQVPVAPAAPQQYVAPAQPTVRVAPAAPQQPVAPAQPTVRQQPRTQRQWSSNPEDFTQTIQRPGQGQPTVTQRVAPGQPMPQRSVQPGQPMPPQRPGQPGGRPQRTQRQWSSNPNDFGGPKPSGKVELQPIEQQVSEVTATGERLQNLPPQQAPSDPDFDTDSYVRNLQQQIKDDQNSSKESVDTQGEILRQAENVDVKPMKFDGKQLKGANVNVVKAPKKANKNLMPIVVVVILVIALLGIAAYIFFFSGLLNKDVNIKFKKADGWSDTVYAVTFNNKSELNYDPKDPASLAKCSQAAVMSKESDGSFTLKVKDEYKEGRVFFVDSNGNTCPDKVIDDLNDTNKDEVGFKVEKDKEYVASASKTSQETSKAK